MIKEIRYKTSFRTQDQEGNERLLHVFVDILDAGAPGNPNAEIEGLRSIRTEAGDHVNKLEKGKYEIVHSGEILTSDDPEAA